MKWETDKSGYFFCCVNGKRKLILISYVSLFLSFLLLRCGKAFTRKLTAYNPLDKILKIYISMQLSTLNFIISTEMLRNVV